MFRQPKTERVNAQLVPITKGLRLAGAVERILPVMRLKPTVYLGNDRKIKQLH